MVVILLIVKYEFRTKKGGVTVGTTVPGQTTETCDRDRFGTYRVLIYNTNSKVSFGRSVNNCYWSDLRIQFSKISRRSH